MASTRNKHEIVNGQQTTENGETIYRAGLQHVSV